MVFPDPAKVKYGDSTMMKGFEACRELLEEGVIFSALFACNDDMALGASKALHQAGLKIPQDVSLFGFDDAPAPNGWSRGCRPSICRLIA